jgi:hypothetical protein
MTQAPTGRKKKVKLTGRDKKTTQLKQEANQAHMPEDVSQLVGRREEGEETGSHVALSHAPSYELGL